MFNKYFIKFCKMEKNTSDDEKYPIITWKNKNEGWRKYKNGENTIYSREYGILMYAISIAGQYIQNYYELLRDGTFPMSKNYIENSRLTLIYPSLCGNIMHLYNNKSNFNTIRLKIEAMVRLVMKTHFKKLDKKEIDQHDSDFLALLAMKHRNYKSDCAICLTDNIMGTTCGCGHREIAVFRPCGHSVCVNPCFQEFVKHNDIKLQQQTFKVGNQTMYVVGKKKIDGVGGFDCPICRQEVRRTFRFEETSIADDLKNKIKDTIDEYINMKFGVKPDEKKSGGDSKKEPEKDMNVKDIE
jgi:hypothetical protein